MKILDNVEPSLSNGLFGWGLRRFNTILAITPKIGFGLMKSVVVTEVINVWTVWKDGCGLFWQRCIPTSGLSFLRCVLHVNSCGIVFYATWVLCHNGSKVTAIENGF